MFFNQELTEQEAADILNISVSYLAQLLEHAEIPSIEAETSKRVLFSDVMAYKKRREQEQREALEELTRISEELGLYE